MFKPIKSLLVKNIQKESKWWLYLPSSSFQFDSHEIEKIKRFALEAQGRGDVWVWIMPDDETVRLTSFRELKPVTLWNTLNSEVFTSCDSRFWGALPRIKMPIDMLKLGLKLTPKETGIQGLITSELALTIAREDFEPSVSGSDLLDCEHFMNEIQVETADMLTGSNSLHPSHFSWRYRHNYGFEFCLHNSDIDKIVAFVPLQCKGIM